MDIEGVFVGGGSMTSLVVLRTRDAGEEGAPLKLPICIGSVEAHAITMGVAGRRGARPMTHDLLSSTISALGAQTVGVRIVSVQGTTFFAQLELRTAGGEHVFVDARPSDALALAVRDGVALWAEEGVLRTAALPDFRGVEHEEYARELQEFHEFVEGLTPDDFALAHGEKDGE